MLQPELFHILVTDINHHVRALLKRELEKEHFAVSCLNNGMKVYSYMITDSSCDLIILDPELLRPYGLSQLKNALNSCTTTIILHTYSNIFGEINTQNGIIHIEKNDRSIVTIKEKAWDCYCHKAASPQRTHCS